MTESVMTREQGDTWYRIVGDLDPSAAQVPLVVLHGGPGACHDYTIPIAELANRTGRAAVLYDQIGCGLSSHMPDQPADFWTVDLFKTELTELLKHLGIAGRYNLVGQSWGGMLGMDYAIDQPAGLNTLGVCDSPARMDLWVSEANRLRAELPPGVDETLQRHEDAGTTESPEYQDAMQVFYDKHVCRVVPNPDFVTRSFAKLAEDPTVYYTMNGPANSTASGHCARGISLTTCMASQFRHFSSAAGTTKRLPRSSAKSPSEFRITSGSSLRKAATCRTSRNPSVSPRCSTASSPPTTESCTFIPPRVHHLRGKRGANGPRN